MVFTPAVKKNVTSKTTDSKHGETVKHSRCLVQTQDKLSVSSYKKRS